MIKRSFFFVSARFTIVLALYATGILLFNGGRTAILRAATAPDWLSAVKQVDLGSFAKGSPAVVVGQWTDFSVDATGKYLSTERRAIRVLDLKAATRYLQAVGYENSDESVVSIRTWAIPVSGRVVESQKKDVITQATYSQFELFSDSRVKTLAILGAEAGALVGYEIVRTGRLPLNGERFALEDQIPVLLGELHISVPSGSVRWFLNHPDRVQIVSQSPTAASFRSVNRPGILDEDDVPPFWSLVAAVFVNYDSKGSAAVHSWEDAGRAIHPLLSAAEKSAPEISTQMESLSAGQAELLGKLNAAYTFVSRQIRYVAVEIGIGGFQPHPAADVFRNKYGDCKDKATLLLTMLDHVGLRGYPALVGTRGEIEADPAAPTLTAFNHMIVALPVPAELEVAVEHFPSYDSLTHILWIDPTSETDALGHLPSMDQGVFALISYPDRGELRRIPETSAELNGVDYRATLQLGPDGSGIASVEEKYLGTFNSYGHSLYRNLSQDQIRKTFEERVTRYANQAVFRQAAVAGTETNNGQIVESFSFRGSFVSASTGDSWFFQPLFLAGISVREISPRPRTLPLEVGTPFRVRGEYRIELPIGMHVAGLPQEISIKSEFGWLEVKYSVSGNVLVTTETHAFTASRVPADKFEAFREFVNAVRRVAQVRLRATAAQ